MPESQTVLNTLKRILSNDLLKQDFADLLKVNSLNGFTITWIQTQTFLEFAEIAKAIATLILLVLSVWYTAVKLKSVSQHLKWDKEDRQKEKALEDE